MTTLQQPSNDVDVFRVQGRAARRNRGELIDGCGRRIDHLRLSVTCACDFRCIYCKPTSAPPDGRNAFREPSDLTDDQRIRFVRYLHERYGLKQVRITGGEPLLYPNLESLVAGIRAAAPGLSIAMTTNGRLLYQRGFNLRRAGLDRLNVSLDSLDPDRYHKITGGCLDDVLRGIESAMHVGFSATKINTVVLRGVNDHEITDLATWALRRGLEIRFLEAMPIGPASDVNRRGFYSATHVRARLSERFALRPLPYLPGETARRYSASAKSCSGVVGVIAPVSDPFCGGCRRIRLTAAGRIFPCLLDDHSTSITPLWSSGAFDERTAGLLLRESISRKQPRGGQQSTAMIQLGG